MRLIFRILALFSWALNLASLVGYFLLRRQMSAPRAATNKLRFLIIRPYKSEVDETGEVMSNSESDELHLMNTLFRTAREYGNARVVVVTNNGDPGFDKIRALAAPYTDIVRVIEAPIMPPNTPSGQLFNHKIGWRTFEEEARDNDILLTTDCDSDLTTELLYQVAHAYEDEAIGGVGTYPLYEPARDPASMNYVMALNPGMGFLALNSLARGTTLIIGNFLSVRVAVFRQFGGYDSYTPFEQFVDDVATSKKVLASGKKLAMVGSIRVYNRYGSFPAWWERWSRMMVQIKAADPSLFFPSPLPTYGAQVISEVVLVYGLATRKRAFTLPFFVNLAVNFVYGSLTSAWRDAMFSPISALLNMAGWVYAIFNRSRTVRWRGVVFEVRSRDKTR